MGSSSDFLIRMDTNNSPDNNSFNHKVSSKKFSPFSVDSLLATKVKKTQEGSQNHNNNDLKNDEQVQENDHPGRSTSPEGLDLSLKTPKKEELLEDDFIEEEDDEDLDMEDEEDEECDDNSESTKSLANHPPGSILAPHARFPFPLGLPHSSAAAAAVSCLNPVNPWIPQFRSPLNPFLQSKYFYISLYS